MGTADRRDLPPEAEARIRQILALEGDERAAAVRQFQRELPEHAARLAAVLAGDATLGVGDSAGAGPVAERLRRLAARPGAADRYRVHGEIARGGMGIVLRAWDKDLGRPLAMKVSLLREEAAGQDAGEGEASVDPRVLERFVEEAQITGQLDHPGVVPVHELGLDAQGHPYFTMRLVKGRTAQEIFALARERAEGWTPTRAIEVLLKVCDTLAYAHSKGVVHRDLKPSNVMVGRYGEVYVMDWGLAKILGQEDSRDLRIREPASTSLSRVRTDRSTESESDPDSPLRTMDGAIVGTPCYMPPEQACGHVEQVGIRSDVYAAGAMLYTLLAGTQPYVKPGSQTSPYMILQWVREGPPPPVHRIDRAAPAELVAICERAMARDATARYPDMTALADDLRAWLERRVVRAYRTGARAELWAWVRRNRGMAAGLAVALLAVVAGGIGAVVYAGEADAARRSAQQEQQSAKQARDAAETARGDAERALADLREEQRRKAELDEELRRHAMRTSVEQEQMLASLREQGREQQLREALRQIQCARDVDAQLCSLAQSGAEGPAGDDPRAAGDLFALLSRLIAGGAHEEDWSRWVRGRWLVLHGRADEALAVVEEPAPAAAPATVALLLQALLQGCRADAHAQLGEPLAALTGRLAALDAFGDLQRAVQGSDLGAEETRLLADWSVATAKAAADVALHDAAAGQHAPLLQGLGAWAARRPGSPPAKAAACLQVAADLLRGRLDEASAHLRRLAQLQVAWPEMAAAVARASGRVGVALDLLRGSGPFAGTAVPSPGAVLEEARCWLAVHRPRAALAALGTLGAPGSLEGAGPGAADPRVRAEAASLRAEALERLGHLPAASSAWAVAAESVPQTAAPWRARLLRAQARVEHRLGHADEAIARLVGVPPEAATAQLGGLPSHVLLALAAAARDAGRPALAEAADAAAALGAASVRERAAVLLERSRQFLGRGQAGDAVPPLDRLADLLPSSSDDWLAMRAHAHTAAVLAALGRSGEALANLDRAARAHVRWLADHARFAGPPAGLGQLGQLEAVSAEAVAALAAIAGSLGPDDVGVAFGVLEALADPVPRLLQTRPARLLAHGLDRRTTEACEAPRAGLLGAAEGAGSERRRRAASRLRSAEAQLRERRPAYGGAVFPRPVDLRAAMGLMPVDAALVSFTGGAGAGGVALAVTARTAALVPLRVPADLAGELAAVAAGGAEAAAALERLGAALVQPVLEALRAADAGRIRLLVLAPAGDLRAVPFALCAARDPAAPERGPLVPLLALHDVVHVPSGTAAHDQVLELRSRRGRPFRQLPAGALAMVAPADPDRGRWLAAALEPPDPASPHGGERLPAAGADGTIRRGALRVLAGASASTATLAAMAEHSRVLALALELDTTSPHHPCLRTAAVPIELQDLRDLAAEADLALVRNAAAAPLEPSAEALALAGCARALWSGGCAAVVTASAATPHATASRVVASWVAAGAAGEDQIAAFGAACRRELAQGTPFGELAGLRLWSVMP